VQGPDMDNKSQKKPGFAGLFFGRDSDHNAPRPVLKYEVVL
jgi:hypothetical protein